MTNAKGWIILAVVLLIAGFYKLRPASVPIQNINISPAAGLETDQSDYTKLAIEALTAKLKIKKEDISVQKVQATQWNDSSLGCPQKGKLYIQSITTGFVIELSAQGKKYIYNGGLNRVVSC